MQIPLIPETCARCGRPVLPGEPVMRSAAVDLADGRVVASPVRAIHVQGGCRDGAGRYDAATASRLTPTSRTTRPRPPLAGSGGGLASSRPPQS